MKIDPRLKLIMALLVLFLILLAKTVLLPIVFLLAAVFLLVARKPKRGIYFRMIPGFLMGCTVLLTQLFWYGQEPLAAIHIGLLDLTVYNEGVYHGFLLASKIWGSVAVLVILSVSLSVPEVITAARWMRVPEIILGLCAIAYRYIFILYEEMVRIRRAQRIRFGYTGWGAGIKSAGSLGGLLVLRSFDKSIALTRSMVCRGFDGEVKVFPTSEASWQGIVPGGLVILVLLSLFFMV